MADRHPPLPRQNLAKRAEMAYGSVLITDTQPHGGKLGPIVVINNAVFDVLDGDMEGDPSGITFSAGTVIWGVFTNVQLASGVIQAGKLLEE